MSYDLRLCDPNSGATLELEQPHSYRGGTYAAGGAIECWLSVTCNYVHIFRRVLGDDGIKALYGLTGGESIPVLEQAISHLHGGPDENYWRATDGNARRALEDLLALARLRPEGVWAGEEMDPTEVRPEVVNP
jgi:hypothetical protein